MPVIQVNFWQCERCEKVYSSQCEVSPHSDPVVTYPTIEDWDYEATVKGEILICPICIRHSRETHKKWCRTFPCADEDWVGTADNIIHKIGE